VKASLQERASAHAVVAAADLSRAKAFYSDVLGLLPDEDRGSAVRYGMGGGTWFMLYQSERARPAGTTRLRFEVDDVRDVVEQLKARGVVFEEYDLPDLKTVNGVAEHPSGARGAWFKDPDGNILQIGQYPSPARS
jgi:catechol 2,3-dioxygenase-like lactoylglutathione lyase family enzyme